MGGGCVVGHEDAAVGVGDSRERVDPLREWCGTMEVTDAEIARAEVGVCLTWGRMTMDGQTVSCGRNGTE